MLEAAWLAIPNPTPLPLPANLNCPNTGATVSTVMTFVTAVPTLPAASMATADKVAPVPIALKSASFKL